jgi:acyl dehydratase
MPLKADILGMTHEYPDYFEVGRENVRQFARAIKADDPASFDEAAAAELGHDAIVAPLTFASILALQVQKDFFMNVDIGVATMQIVQVDQKFFFHRPIMVGDKLTAWLEVTSVDQRFGADIVTTHNKCHTPEGELVMEAWTTLMGHEGDASISAKWDPETGQVVRTAATD